MNHFFKNKRTKQTAFNIKIIKQIVLSFKERAATYMIWVIPSVIGGFIGGSVRLLLKKTPYALLILFVGIIFQLFLYGTSSWGDIIGISQNVTFCLMSSFFY